MSIYNLPAKYNTPVLLYGTRKRAYPLEAAPLHFTVSESYLVKADFYERIPRNTPNDVYTDAFLCDQQITREEGDGIWYDCIFATVPPDIVDYVTGSYAFPGLDGVRAPMPARTVRCKTVRRFYRVGSVATPTLESVPFTPQTSLWYDGAEIGFILGGNTITIDQVTVSTGGDAPGVTIEPLAIGGMLFDSGMGLDGAGSGAKTDYLARRAADLASAGSFSIVVESSLPTRYMGDIWFTDTVYTKAV